MLFARASPLAGVARRCARLGSAPGAPREAKVRPALATPYRVELVREGADVLDGTRAQPLEQGQDFGSNSSAKKSWIPIGGIDAVGHAMPHDVRVDGGPASPDHRSDAFSLVRRQHGEAPRARSA